MHGTIEGSNTARRVEDGDKSKHGPLNHVAARAAQGSATDSGLADERSMLTVSEAAHRFGVSKRHFYRLVQDGLAPAPIPLGLKCKRWPAKAVDRAIDEFAEKSWPARGRQHGR